MNIDHEIKGAVATKYLKGRGGMAQCVSASNPAILQFPQSRNATRLGNLM
jgi:hypothetical protein